MSFPGDSNVAFLEFLRIRWVAGLGLSASRSISAANDPLLDEYGEGIAVDGVNLDFLPEFLLRTAGLGFKEERSIESKDEHDPLLNEDEGDPLDPGLGFKEERSIESEDEHDPFVSEDEGDPLDPGVDGLRSDE